MAAFYKIPSLITKRLILHNRTAAYIGYTYDIPAILETSTATFADDTDTAI